MKKIIIIGAGGFGRELLLWIKDINKKKPTWDIAGFIDDNITALDGVECDYSIIGTVKDWIPKYDEVFALAVADPYIKEKIVTLMKAKGAVFATIIHPTAIITQYSYYGEGLIMFPYSKLSCNSTAGDFVAILSSPIGHDTEIGDYSTISGNCNVVRNVKIGKYVFLAAGVCIAQDVHIGDNAYLGLGCVVLKDVNPGAKMFGNPARALPN
ncbi:MAG: hypothetical protein WC152_02390 [Candidatus Izemoplasmatales bacterium]